MRIRGPRRQGRPSGQSQRDQTDRSLRDERAESDARIAAKQDVVEDKADEVVRVARERADTVLQTAREEADREQEHQTAAAEAIGDRERDVADEVVGTERAEADAALEGERHERRRFLEDLLSTEREATDIGLVGERAHADTAISARDEFLGNVSHDLRSLLGGVSLNAALLIRRAPEGPDGDAERHVGTSIQRLVARMSRMVHDLLDLVSIEGGRLAVVPEDVDVAGIVRDTLDAFAPVAAAKHVALEVDVPERPITAVLDGDRILQVLANLVSNAVKFTPTGGHVTVRVHAEGDEIHLTVSDTGIGIPGDKLESVFERFEQVSPDRRGLGLGLHISRSIVEAHGGRMWVVSERNRGSTFHVALPRTALAR